jgi:heme/copper-type cytochrome/quinol oxidase subunit 2
MFLLIFILVFFVFLGGFYFLVSRLPQEEDKKKIWNIKVISVLFSGAVALFFGYFLISFSLAEKVIWNNNVCYKFLTGYRSGAREPVRVCADVFDNFSKITIITAGTFLLFLCLLFFGIFFAKNPEILKILGNLKEREGDNKLRKGFVVIAIIVAIIIAFYMFQAINSL